MATLEELELNGIATVGNIYVDGKYTATDTPATNPITGEALTFGENAFGAFGPTYQADNATVATMPTGAYPTAGSAYYITNINIGDIRINTADQNSTTVYDVYVSGVTAQGFYVLPQKAGTYTPAGDDKTLSVYVDSMTLNGNGYHGFGTTQDANFTGDYAVTIKNSTMNYLAIATGSAWGVDNGTFGNHKFAKVDGNITFNLDNVTVNSVAGMARGQIGTADNHATITGTITNSKFGNTFHIIQTGTDGNGQSFNSWTDIDITVTGSSFSGAWMTLPNQSSASRNDRGELTTHGSVSLKMTGTTVNGLVVGAGRSGTGWQRVGWVDGDIELKLTASTTGRTYLNKGYVGHAKSGSETEQVFQTVTTTVDEGSVVGDFVAYELRGDKADKVFANTTISVTASTIGNFTFLTTINSGGSTTSVGDKLYGAQVLNFAGARTGNLQTGAATHKDATFAINFLASDVQGVSGDISGQWNTITVEAGANVRVGAITMANGGGTLTIAADSAFSATTLTNVSTIQVTGELTEAETILISGLTGYDEGKLPDTTKVMVGDTEYVYGLFGANQYYISSTGDLILHGESVLVNSEYTNGQPAYQGATGYSSIAKAQAKVATTTPIAVFGLDPDHYSGNVLDENVTTKDYIISFVTDEDHPFEFNGKDILIGDSAAVDKASLKVSYTNNINVVTFGNITNTASVSFDNSEIAILNLTSATVGNAQLSFTSDEIEDLYLADQAGFQGTITVADSTITNVYGGASGLNIDLTGGNTITNVYANGNGDAIKLGTSTVEDKFVAGYATETEVETFGFTGGVNANEFIVGGDAEANTFGTLKATITQGDINTLRIGGYNDEIGNAEVTFLGGDIEAAEFIDIGGDLDLTVKGGTFSYIELNDIDGDANLVFDGGKIGSVDFRGDIEGNANVTLSGGSFGSFTLGNVGGKSTVTLAGGTVAAIENGAVVPSGGSNSFAGIVYGATITGMLDGGSGNDTSLIVDGNAKVDSIIDFSSLDVVGGTLNVAGTKENAGGVHNPVSDVQERNTIEIYGDITNRRGINAGAITAYNLTNTGLIGVLRDNDGNPGIALSGDLINSGYIKTSVLKVDGDFENSGKITAVGDIEVKGSFSNSGDIYFRSTFSQDGVFSQFGGLILGDYDSVDVENTGFISAATLTGVKNLTTSKMYITGGAEIEESLTILADAEVAFTNKAKFGEGNGLTLGDDFESITMYDTSALIVSGEFDTEGSKNITINCGDLIGYNEIIRVGSGLSSWQINLAGASAGNYELVQDDVSVLIYSTDEVFVCSEYDEDAANYFNGNQLLYGKNAFATVAEAVAGAKAGAKIHLLGDFDGADVAAAGFDVILDGATNIGGLTAKTVTVIDDSDVETIVSTNRLTIKADSLLTVAETLPTALPITIDASAGAGSRLVLDVDPKFQTLTESQVTVISPSGKSYAKRILAGEGEHAGDLYIVSNDKYAYYVPSLYKTENETLVPTFADGEAFDRATGDALFANVNTFGDKDQAIQAAKDIKGIFVLVGDVVENAVGEADVQTMIEVDRARGDSGQSRAIVGIHDDGNTIYVSDQDHTTIIAGSTSTGNVYGLTRWYDMSGDYTLIAQDSVSTGSALWITGNNHDNVTNGDITAVITGSTFNNVYLGAGDFGTYEDSPIDINITVSDSRLGAFYGIHTQRGNEDPTNRQDINANININIYDTVIGGTFTVLNTNNDHWNGQGATLLQTYFTAGSINVEIGGSTMTDNIRVGASLEAAGKAFQAYNVRNTLHIVATDQSTTTIASYLCEWDSIIVDATAQLQLNTLQYSTIAIGELSGTQSDRYLDYEGTLTQVMINMSGYKSGTHAVIVASNRIYTDVELSNITVIGDNDLTGQCELAYITNTTYDAEGTPTDVALKAVYVFDKTDDMFVNTSYTDAINGTADEVTGQEFLFSYNAHADFEKAFGYANEWGGTITVTGGRYADMDFKGNNVAIRKGASFDTVTMADTVAEGKVESFLSVEDGAKIGVIDGSKDNINSTLIIEDDTDFAVVQDFTTVLVVDAVATFDSLSGSDITITAASMLLADELDLTDSAITIDVTGFAGLSHVIVGSFDDIVGYDESNIEIVGENKDKFSVLRVDNDIVLRTTIASDTFLNSEYTEAITGTIMYDGTYLEYGINAFSDAASAVAGLGSRSNTLTITGGNIADDLVMNGANFVLEGGALQGVLYATYEKDYRNMSITVGDGSVGGIEMTAQDGSYQVTKASITLEDGAIVTGSISGAGDTVITVDGDAFVNQTIGNVKSIVIDANACLTANTIELAEGGSIAITGTLEGSNYHKVISTQTALADDPIAEGFRLFKKGNDIYVLGLSRIYFDEKYSSEDYGRTLDNGDVIYYGINAFSDLNAARAAAYANKAMLCVVDRKSNITITGTTIVSLAIQDSTVASLQHGLTTGQTAENDIHDVHVVIDNSTVNTSDGFIFGEGNWQNRNTFSGNFTLDVTDSVLGGGRTRIATFFTEGNKNVVINVTDSSMLGDLSIIEDSPFGGSDSVEVNLTNVSAPVTKWWTFFDGYPGESGGTINVNIKDSVLGNSTGFRFGVQRSCGASNNVATDVTFTVDNSTVTGGLFIERVDGSGSNLINYTGHATLNVIGTNYVRYSLKFHEVNIGADASISGSTLSLRSGGEINIDATGYDGPTKAFIYMSNQMGDDNTKLNVTGVNKDLYDLVVTSNAVVVFDGTIGNLYWNPTYTLKNTGWTSSLGDVILVHGSIEGKEDVQNAYSAQDDVYDDEGVLILSGLDKAKLALTEGNQLVVTGVGADGKFFGTIDSVEVTDRDIDVVILDGNFTAEGAIVAAADEESGKVSTGGSWIEIAGGTFGKAASGEDPAVLASINGSRYSIAPIEEGKGSHLTLSYDTTMYANVSDFDDITVTGNVKVVGTVDDVDALYIDCNGSLSVDGELDAESVKSIVLSSGDYTGPSKIVLHSASLSPEAIAQITITVDGSTEDDWYYDGESDIWLISNDASNVYLDARFSEAINGTTTSRGDLLYFEKNAVATMDEAIAKTTSDYQLIVSGGVFAGDYSLASIGGSSVFVDGGTIGSLTLGSGKVNTRVELTGATSTAVIGTLTGDENGLRLIVDKDSKVGTVNNANYVRVGIDQNNSIDGINYVAAGGQLVLDLSQFEAREGEVLKVEGGINNFLVPVAGETYSLAVIQTTNAATRDYAFYYDAASSSVVSVKMDDNIFVNTKANADMNGTVIGGSTVVYGYNLNRDTSAIGNAKTGATLYVEGVIDETLRTENDTNAVITLSRLTDVRLGPTMRDGNTHRRTGDFMLDVIGGTFAGGNVYLAGRGDGSTTTLIVGEQADADSEIVDGTWNLTFRALKDDEGKIIARSRHENNGGTPVFKVTENAQVAGGIVNMLFENYDLAGDMFLFDNITDVTVGGEAQSLKEINVTMTDVICPAAKWVWFWDPTVANATAINLTITDSYFTGDTMGFGLFGTDTSNWTGVADVTISGVTVNGGTFSGGKGANGDDNGVNGVRKLHVVGGENSFNVLKQFTSIEIADGLVLKAATVSMAANETGFILRGEAGYTGDAKEYVVANSITGATSGAQFLDAEGNVIEGYVAVVGATNVFVYTPDVGAIYYGNNFTAANINGYKVEDALTGKTNFLVFGDNAVATMDDAYARATAHNENIIVVQNAKDENLYANGYQLIVNGGSIGTLYGFAPGEEAAVAAVDVTLNKGVTVKDVIVAAEGSTVTGDALITIGDGASIGTLDGGYEFVNGQSSLVFEGDATVFSIKDFDNVTIKAVNEVTLTSTFGGSSLTIDVTGFEGASKRVMTVEGGAIPEGLVISAGGYGTEWVDGKMLVLVSNVVTDVYVNTDWTPADVDGKFVGDMLLVWNKNAFGELSSAAVQAVGQENTLYVDGNVASTEALTIGNSNVIFKGATVGLGAITANDTVLTVESTEFTAASLSGISALSVKADAVAISGGIAMTGDGKLTIDVTGHTQTDSDAVILTTESGISGLAQNITLTGEGANKYYAYYNQDDGDIHLLRVDNLYVDIGFGTAGELIPEGATNGFTHERLLFGANAFYSLTDALGRLSDGMGLYINARPYDVRTNDKQPSDFYLTNSSIPVLINGYTSGDQTIDGDVTVKILDSTVGAGGDSTLVMRTRVDTPYDHLNTVNGNVNVEISGSTLGSATDSRTINVADYIRVNNGDFTVNVTDSVVCANLEVYGDSHVGNDEKVNVTFKNVSASVDRNWWITDGNRNNAGTINVTLDNVTLGAGNMQIATQSDWNYGDRTSSNNVTFSVTDSTISGSLSADVIGREEVTTYSGAKVLEVTGDNAISQVLWFKNINIDAASTLTADTISMSSVSAKVTIDAQAYTGQSRVLISATDGITNLTEKNITLLKDEDAEISFVTDYNAQTKSMSMIVLKAAVKDIYANEDYTLEELPLGTTYNGEALFFDYNAFDSAADAIAALTAADASLYITGSLSAAPGGQLITVNGNLVNEGTFKISADGFVDGSQSEAKILTASAISGSGKFTTDNAAYTVTVRDDKDVYLVLKKVDVFVNTDWADLEAGATVDVPGGTAILGTDAFATADAAASKVSANGTITVINGDVKFSSAIVRTVTAMTGTTIQNANIGTANAAGSLTLQSGAAATNAQVRNGTLTVGDGAKVLGGLMINDGGAVSFGANTSLELDISKLSTASAAVLTGYSLLTGSPDISITIAADQADGTYTIATDAAAFGAQAVTVKTSAATITSTLTVGNTERIEGIDYTLALTEDNVLTLKKKVYEEPITVAYVDPSWADLEDGDIVTITGTTAIIGKDAFADADLATEAVISTGIVKVTAGKVTFANGITKQTEILSGAELTNTNVSSVLTVDAGATLSGKAVFGDDAVVTVNGTVVFDLALATEGAQFTGFAVTGNAKYELVGESALGDYTLATGVTAFTSLTVGSETLAVGDTLVIGDTFAYTLSLTAGTLALNIAEYVPPVVIPTITYVNSDWVTKPEGAIIPIDGGTAVYMYDAFSTGDEAIAAVTDDGEVKVLGGTVSFTDAIAKTVTISADATLYGKATFGAAITIDGTVAFDTANATSTDAQFNGFSFVSGETKYTLNAASATAGTYLLASDVTAFTAGVKFGDETLKVGDEAIKVGNLTYKLDITDNSELALTIAPTKKFVAGSDIDGNGISDVLFVWTGTEEEPGNYQHGYWMNGTNEWQSAEARHPSDWDNLGCYDMTGDGKADSVLFGNVNEEGIRGAYIGYYTDGNDLDANWETIGHLESIEVDWKNKVGNLTGNEKGANSIVWYAAEMHALGAWKDGKEDWVFISDSFGSDWTLIGCGDFDGDGKDSIMMAYNGGQLFYTADIDGTVTAMGDANWSGWEVRAIGDFMGDGKDDMVLFHNETGSMVMLADGRADVDSEGKAIYIDVGQLSASDWFVVGAGDYDGDKKDDLLVRQYSTGWLGYYSEGIQDNWNLLGRGVGMEWTVIA